MRGADEPPDATALVCRPRVSYVGHMTKAIAQPAAARGAATRDALLDAAATLIPERGWTAVTTRAVAERAGVRPGLVHYHFPSVEAVLVAAVVRVAQQVVGGAQRAVEAAPDLGAGVDALLTSVTAPAPDDPATLLLTEAALASSRIPSLRQALTAVLSGLRDAVADWLADADHPGDVAATAAVLVAALDGLAVHRAIDPDLDDESIRLGLRALVGAPAPGDGG
jgi:AcrR family transcriptional regulator